MSESLPYTCVTCGDQFVLERLTTEAKPPFPKDWHVYVVHDHEGTEILWRGVLFYHPKGAKWPIPAKVLQEKQTQAKRDALVARQVDNASHGSGRSNDAGT
jgi:hypothetical protein